MMCFIWKRVNELTYNYHEEGGLVVIAKDWDAAKLLLSSNKRGEDEYCYDGLKNEFLSNPSAPDISFKCEKTVEPQIIVFPDSGCC